MENKENKREDFSLLTGEDKTKLKNAGYTARGSHIYARKPGTVQCGKLPKIPRCEVPIPQCDKPGPPVYKNTNKIKDKDNTTIDNFDSCLFHWVQCLDSFCDAFCLIPR